MIGYGLIDCVVGGQILSAVSPNGMSVAVGIVIIAIISWVVATFGIQVFHYYERFAFSPQVIVVCILFGVSSVKFDLSTVSEGDARTVAGNRLSFFSICVSAAITYAPLAADFFVYYPENTSRAKIFGLSLAGLLISFTMALVCGVGLASGIPTHPEYSAAYNEGQGALIVEGFGPLHGFGKFCSVVCALGLIANTVAPTYSAGIDFQILGRYAEAVPRVIWNTIAVIIYTVCALVGRSHLSEIFTNFLALMGYWVAIWTAITLEECFIFRARTGYNWAIWRDPSKLPIGIAGFIAFVVGWVGAILCMAQVWYIGPIAKLVGAYGADWGAENKDTTSDQPQGFSTNMGEKCQLLLSDKIRGYFLVPEDNVWNYSFMGSSFGSVEKRPIYVKIDTPLKFYDDQHRPLHFQNFAELEDIWVDRADNFA
ncbi:Vitamin B6 transporter [Elasticomyces elasticus]|nr:Vitamin B6 transporter [Elasticomyces elasticus]